MAQVVLIKNANTPSKEIGHLVGIYEDDHEFSNLEIAEYTIKSIPGYTKKELWAHYQATILPVEKIIEKDGKETDVFQKPGGEEKTVVKYNKFRLTFPDMEDLTKVQSVWDDDPVNTITLEAV